VPVPNLLLFILSILLAFSNFATSQHMKQLFKFGTIILILIGIARFCHFQTEGFRISKIRNNTFSEEETVYSVEEKREAQALLKQPFTYLARGKQSFVFLSEDGQTVLKLLNNQYQKKMGLLNLVPKMGWQQEKLSYFHKKLEQTKASYLLAKGELKEETGVLFLHLNRSNDFHQKVKIIDKLGIAHEIDLDKTGFILQKKATLAYPALEGWINSKEIDSAKEALSSLLSLLKTRYQKKINDKDPLIRTNLGFIGTQAYFLDLGPFSKNFNDSTPVQQVEQRKILHSLRAWLEKKEPSLALFLDEEMKRVL
jgi:hypothetical protein